MYFRVELDLAFVQLIAFYPYRSAFVHGVEIADPERVLFEQIKEFLAEYGYSMDNHICFTDSHGVSYMYSDGYLTVGTLTAGKW